MYLSLLFINQNAEVLVPDKKTKSLGLRSVWTSNRVLPRVHIMRSFCLSLYHLLFLHGIKESYCSSPHTHLPFLLIAICWKVHCVAVLALCLYDVVTQRNWFCCHQNCPELLPTHVEDACSKCDASGTVIDAAFDKILTSSNTLALCVQRPTKT